MNSLKKTLTKDLTSADVERKGQNSYKIGKTFMFCGLCGLALMLVICLTAVALGTTFINPLLFHLDSSYAFAYPLIAVAYLAILLGIFGIALYNIGIQRFALGRIAVNTEKADNYKVTADDDLPEL